MDVAVLFFFLFLLVFCNKKVKTGSWFYWKSIDIKVEIKNSNRGSQTFCPHPQIFWWQKAMRDIPYILESWGAGTQDKDSLAWYRMRLDMQLWPRLFHLQLSQWLLSSCKLRIWFSYQHLCWQTPAPNRGTKNQWGSHADYLQVAC